MADDKTINFHTDKNKKNQNIQKSDYCKSTNKNIENLSIIIKLAKSKNFDFVKSNSFKIDFLTSEVKKSFIYFQKAFIKAFILQYFDLKYYIYIKKTDTLRYIISRVLN